MRPATPNAHGLLQSAHGHLSAFAQWATAEPHALPPSPADRANIDSVYPALLAAYDTAAFAHDDARPWDTAAAAAALAPARGHLFGAHPALAAALTSLAALAAAGGAAIV